MTSLFSLILPPSITPWSREAGALKDLLGIYGSAMDSLRARQWLQAFAMEDFSGLPPVVVLSADRMPGLWGGYSRDKNRIYLSADCPPENLAEVLLEEVGHFLDRELCASETPGEEGARFAALVLRKTPSSAQLASWAVDEGFGMVFDQAGLVLVEGAKKKSSGGKNKKSNRSKYGGSTGKNKKKRASQLAASSDASDSLEPVGNRPPKPSDFVSMDLESVQTYEGQTLYSTKADSTFVVSSLNVRIAGNLGGNDSIKTEVNGLSLSKFPEIENLILTGEGHITAEGNGANNLITGNRGSNTLTGLGGNDSLLGFFGNDSLDGGAGNDSMVGGTGNDTYVVDSVGDVIVESSNEGKDSVQSSVSLTLALNVEDLELTGSAPIQGTGNQLGNSLIGNGGKNSLSGLGGNDTLLGGEGDDTLLGGGEEDLLVGGTGGDSMVGGSGSDTYVVDSVGDAVVEFENEGIDEVQASVNLTLSANLERLVLIGAATSGAGNLLANTLIGNLLSNSLDGGAGIDSLVGGAGNDTYFVNSAEDSVFEKADEGKDLVISTVSYTLGADVEVEQLTIVGTAVSATGNSLANTLTGNLLSNSLDGGAGPDSLIGGAGNDTYFVNSLGDSIFEKVGEGEDTAYSSVNHTLALNVENLVLIGSAASGTGNSSANKITGNRGNNLLTGLGGNDTLLGGVGDDTLVVNVSDLDFVDGGEDNDTLRFVSNSGVNLGDANLGRFSNMEAFDFGGVTGDVAVTLGLNAQNLGISTVHGGTGNNTMNASAYTVGVTLDTSRSSGAGGFGSTLAGGKAGDRFILSSQNAFNNSFINGNLGIDTLAFAENGVSLTDDNFTPARISSVEVLQTKDGDNFIQVGTQAAALGLQTLLGGAGADTIDAAAFDNSIAIVAGAGADHITLRSAAKVASSTVAGGLGTDTLSIAEAASLTDMQLSNVSGVEVLSAAATGNSSFTLGVNARAGGIRTVLGGDGNDTLNAGAITAGITLHGGAGNDSLALSIAGNLGLNSVGGGVGTDTLSITADEGSVADADFAKVSMVEVFKTANGNNRVILGTNAQAAGIATVVGGSGHDSIIATSFNSALTIDGGQGDNSLFGGSGNDSLVAYDGADVLDGGAGADTMVGGKGNDTYYVGENGDWVVESELSDAGINYLIVQYDVTNYTTVNGGSATFIVSSLAVKNGTEGNDTLVGTPLKDTISGLGGDDVITGANGADSLMGNTGNDSIDGGAGNDTVLGGSGNDTLLGDTGNDSILGGADADSLIAGAGIDTLLGEAGNDTLVADAIAAASLLGGDDNDSFLLSSGTQVLKNTLVGGTGTDTLVLTAAASITDAQLVNVSGVEVIQASSDGGNVSLGFNAQAGGVLSLFGGVSSDYLSAEEMVSGSIYILGDSSDGLSGDTLVAGAGTTKATLKGNDKGSAENYYRFANASLLGNNKIIGGINSTDIINFDSDASQILKDESFKDISNIDKLIYNNFNEKVIILGANAEKAFQNDTINIEAYNESFVTDTIDLSGVITKKVYLDLTSQVGGAVITAGANRNTLLGGQFIGGDDLFIFKSASSLKNAIVVGGGGTDTLRIAANAQIVEADTISGASSVEVLDIAGAGNKITFGNISAGIATIVGGTGPNTIDASAYNSAPNALTWNMNASNGSDVLLGGANGNLFQIKNGANLQNSFITGNTVTGNTGSDTIELLTGAQTLGDSAFNKISSVEKLKLGSAIKGNSITIGQIAAGNGFATVLGGAGRDTIDASAFGREIWIDASSSSGARLIGSTTAPLGNTLIGGVSGDNVFAVGALGKNCIVGGSNGLDTLAFTTSTTITDLIANGEISDGLTASISRVGTIQFNAAGNKILLGEDALIAGIRTLVGGEDSDNGTGNVFDTSRYGTAGVLFQVTDQNYLNNIFDIIGSSGVDTLKFSRDGVSVTDENVLNLKDIDILRTANGNNHFLIHNSFVTAGIDSIIGGTGRDTINMSDNAIYTPSGVADIITMDMSAGSGYTLISSDSNFQYAKVIGGETAGSVIIDGISLVDNDFENMYQANIGSLTMRTNAAKSVVLGADAKASGLDSLVMLDGNDIIDVSAFLAPLAVSGGGGNDRVLTSFAALADLTFTGGSGTDTLELSGADARSITSLKGSFEVLTLNAGNNFLILGNDADLMTIYGVRSGIVGNDTISMLNNTTGINFVMDPAKLGAGSGFASLDGGSGSDTLSFSDNPGGLFLDNQFSRLGSNFWRGNVGAIENLAAFSAGGNIYDFGVFADNAGISRVYGSTGGGDTFDGSNNGVDDFASRGLDFIFNVSTDVIPDPRTSDFSASTIIGTLQRDTLTVTDNSVTVTDSDFINIIGLEVFRVANGSNDITLGLAAANAGIATVVGGAGNDSLRISSVVFPSMEFDAGAGTDQLILTNPGATFADTGFAKMSSVEVLRTAGGNNDITFGSIAQGLGIASVFGGSGNDTFNSSSYTIAVTLSGNDGNDSLLSGSGNDSLFGGIGADFLRGASAMTGGSGNEIDTLTGGVGADTFALADASNAYYNAPDSGAQNYALITDFAAGTDKLQLKTGVNYVIGSALYGALGGANCYLYSDLNSNSIVDAGENLIAAIKATGGSGPGGALAQADLAANLILV